VRDNIKSKFISDMRLSPYKNDNLNMKEDIYSLLTYFDDEICVFAKELLNEPI
jgi:hypothetical protein